MIAPGGPVIALFFAREGRPSNLQTAQESGPWDISPTWLFHPPKKKYTPVCYPEKVFPSMGSGGRRCRMIKDKQTLLEKIRNSIWAQRWIKAVSGITLGGLLWWVDLRFGERFSWLVLWLLWGGVMAWVFGSVLSKEFPLSHVWGISPIIGRWLEKGISWMAGIFAGGVVGWLSGWVWEHTEISTNWPLTGLLSVWLGVSFFTEIQKRPSKAAMPEELGGTSLGEPTRMNASLPQTDIPDREPLLTVVTGEEMVSREIDGNSEKKQTFTDPRSGKEVESTKLARWGSAMVGCLGLSVLVVFGMQLKHLLSWGVVSTLSLMFIILLVIMLGAALVYALRIPKLEDARSDHTHGTLFSRWAHDGIARWQHSRRQRILRTQDPTHVPDTAISRAQPPGKPQPTDAALSIADDPEEIDHLSVSTTEEDTEDQVPLRQ